MQSLKNEAKSIRSAIKATVVQLDNWDKDKEVRDKKRAAENARYPNGFQDRLDLARFRAKTSSIKANLAVGSCCEYCESTTHATGECDQDSDEEDIQEEGEQSIAEDPSTGIHRAIVHRLYLQSCDLYVLLYPKVFPGPPRNLPTHEESYAVPPAGPDYLALSVTQAVEDFRVTPGFSPSDIRRQREGCVSIALLYYSKAFPITFDVFCHRVADQLTYFKAELSDHTKFAHAQRFP
jgi:hypothetical protein